MNDPVFLRDKDVARIFGMSAEWVRAQRYKRRRDEVHFLNLDARLIGQKPRYVASEIYEFAALVAAGQTVAA